MALQLVSGCGALLCFLPADKPVLDSPESEWLWWLAVFLAY